jgi:ribosomal protein S18 acetylase RimI-like enzyme
MLPACVTLAEIALERRPALFSDATRIFYETSYVRTFESRAASGAFFARWFGNYAKSQADAFFIALDAREQAVAYLAGCIDSFSAATACIRDAIDYYTPAFSSALQDYPSHFHINVEPSFQGKGIGRHLVDRFSRLCRDSGSAGMHVVTNEASPAVKFYEACGFRRLPWPTDAASTLAVLARASFSPQQRL